MVKCGAVGSAPSRIRPVNSAKFASLAASRSSPRVISRRRTVAGSDLTHTRRTVPPPSSAVQSRHRLTARGLERDAAKLAGFAEFTDRIRLGTEPAAPHFTVDNRLVAAVPLEAQVAGLVAQAKHDRSGGLT